MSRFAKLAVATVASTLVMIGLGGLVRATDSGLGCKTWPGCNTATDLIPPIELPAWIEHSHRLWGLVVIALTWRLAVEANRTRQPAAVRRVAVALVPLVLVQALVGASVVWLKLKANLVSIHLTLALVMLGLATWVALDAVRRDGRLPAAPPVDSADRVARLASVTAAVVFAQMILGSLVTGLKVGLAYNTFPSFNGRVVPLFDGDYWFKQGVHVAHRLIAFLLVAMIGWLLLRARRPGVDPVVRRGAELATGLVVVQIVIGALNIWYHLSAWSVVPHMIVGASLWTAVVVIAVRAKWQADGVETPPATAGPDLVAVGAT